MKLWTIFFLSGSIIFISSLGITGIPLEEGMTPQEVKAQIEEMRHDRKEMARELGKERQKKEEELEKREQLIKASQPPSPTSGEEKPAAQEKEAKEGVEEGIEEEQLLPPAEGVGKGIVPGVVTPEEEQTKKIEKQEKVEKEYKSQRDFSFILVIIVMIATIGLLLKSMFKGNTHAPTKHKEDLEDIYDR